ncbi:LysE family translocator [Jatrophihabitans sp.]|uniref:LysE family translocator n=1 Tax=Jatrophihabitans sp. TaxID=1932789 RepID=UPI0030C70BE9|nr:Lysine exporter protein [Jatrophihabitans sp.]
MSSIWEFLLVAALLTLTPGPATALVLRMAARDGRRAALGAVAGNSIAVMMWASLSALGISSLILASQLAYDLLRITGAAFLVVLGLRSLLRRHDDLEPSPGGPPRTRTGIRTGFMAGAANPKLAVFFVALFPQFLSPHAAVLPAALAMGATIVTFDVLWLGTLAWTVERAGLLLRPRLRRGLERTSGTVMIGLGLRIAAEAR